MPRPCTPLAAAQLQHIHALLRLACGAQRALLPVAVGAMNIHDVRDRRRRTNVRQHHCLMPPPRGRGHNNQKHPLVDRIFIRHVEEDPWLWRPLSNNVQLVRSKIRSWTNNTFPSSTKQPQRGYPLFSPYPRPFRKPHHPQNLIILRRPINKPQHRKLHQN